MRTVLRVAAVAVLAACQRDVRDPRVGTIELVLAPVQRASAPDPVPQLERVRDLVARRLASLRVPVEVAKDAGRVVVAVRGDAGPELVSRVKMAVLTEGRIELRELAGNALGPVLVDNGAIRDALSTSSGGAPAIALSLRPGAAQRLEAATHRLVGGRLLLTLDGKVIAAPLVEAPLSGGRIQMTLGNDAARDVADTVALVLNAGDPLPVPLRLLEERRVPARTR